MDEHKVTHEQGQVERNIVSMEEIIDSAGLFNTLEIIAEVCRLKSDHVRTNWQDEHLARAWDLASEGIEALLNRNSSIKCL